ncbi:hypothetical protein OCU04_004480 [Sclerotinia nivalis]|uniref:Uncharacterized protein n=1 Tax=Sclerotinia nivalis TaxID=352851 RepID=A0A9X0AQV7_9HELO|nr:hypothetical protein OCU04_004480 [Sclerotinia nivalis]
MGLQSSTSQLSAGRPEYSLSGARDQGRMNPAAPSSRSSPRYDDMLSRNRQIPAEVHINRDNIAFNTGLGIHDSDPRDWEYGTVDGKRAKILRSRGSEYYYFIGDD